MVAIHELVKDGSQFIIATHSPILLGMPEASILSFGGSNIEETPYELTEHYQITKLFMDDRERLLGQLFGDLG